MSDTLLYFAYGSNLHPLRLGARTPSCRLVSTAQLRGHALRFHKRGADGSAKCDAFATGDPADCVLGVIYALAAADKPTLDRYEGAGYRIAQLQTDTPHGPREVFAYLAETPYIEPRLRPFAWYHELVLCGARYHGFPSSYLDALRTIETVADPDAARRLQADDLLAAMLGTIEGR